MGERVGDALGKRVGALTGDCVGIVDTGARVGDFDGVGGCGMGTTVGAAADRVVGDTVDESLVGSKMGVVTGAEKGANDGGKDGDAGAGACDAIVGVVLDAGDPTEGAIVKDTTVGTATMVGPIPDGAGDGARVKVAFHESGVGPVVVEPGNVWFE
jgi:hypothetical protein